MGDNKMKNRESFKVYQDADGNYFEAQDKDSTLKEIELAVEKPNYKVQQEGLEVYSAQVHKLIQKGAMVRPQLDEYMRTLKLWDDDKQKQLENLDNKITANVLRIKRGGFKLSEARALSIENIRLRSEKLQLLMKRNELDRNTAEALAEDGRFNYYVFRCTVYNSNGKQFFDNFEDFQEKLNGNDVVIRQAFTNLFKLTTNLNEDYRKDWPEYQFLQKYEFVDDKLRLIDRKKRLVDEEGRFLNEDGRYINEQGEFVDFQGNRVDEKGQLIVEETPFIDDVNEKVLQEV